MTIEEIRADAYNLSVQEHYRKLATRKIHVLARQKEWKELAFAEWNGNNLLRLSTNYKVAPQTMKRALDEKMRQKRKEKEANESNRD